MISKSSTTSFVMRVALFSAASAVLGFVKLPSTVGSIALDSLPGYFVAAYFGPLTGGTVGALGHLASAMSAGFPLGFGHLYVALQMFAWCALFGALIRLVDRPWALYVAGVAAIFCNAIITPYLLAIFPIWRPLLKPLIGFLLFAATVNVVAAVLLFRVLSKTRMPGL